VFSQARFRPGALKNQNHVYFYLPLKPLCSPCAAAYAAWTYTPSAPSLPRSPTPQATRLGAAPPQSQTQPVVSMGMWSQEEVHAAVVSEIGGKDQGEHSEGQSLARPEHPSALAELEKQYWEAITSNNQSIAVECVCPCSFGHLFCNGVCLRYGSEIDCSRLCPDFPVNSGGDRYSKSLWNLGRLRDATLLKHLPSPFLASRSRGCTLACVSPPSAGTTRTCTSTPSTISMKATRKFGTF